MESTEDDPLGPESSPDPSLVPGLIVTVDPFLSEPPYAQIRESVRQQVSTGLLRPGTRLPTVRRLAADLGLAVNTVARAYRELEALGLITTRGRSGSFVSGDAVEQAARDAAAAYAERARALGLECEDAVLLLRRAYDP